jgi:hypothetical protein
MRAYDIYCNLSSEEWWSKQSRKVRWLAARYYAGVESLDELIGHTRKCESGWVRNPLLIVDEMRLIVSLR